MLQIKDCHAVNVVILGIVDVVQQESAFAYSTAKLTSQHHHTTVTSVRNVMMDV